MILQHACIGLCCILMASAIANGNVGVTVVSLQRLLPRLKGHRSYEWQDLLIFFHLNPPSEE